MKAHTISAQVSVGESELILAWIHPASQESVNYVLTQPVDTGDGRSEWVWLRLPNGDLILGVFPQGATYETVERDASYREATA